MTTRGTEPSPGVPGPFLASDRLRAQRRDKLYRSSVCWAVGIHIALFLVPLLARGFGRETGYDIPKGSGAETVEIVRIKRIKKPKKRLLLNMNSPIIFHVPKIDEITILDELTEMTEEQYRAASLRDKIGKGGGKAGGWPGGMEGAVVRFIRLKYAGGDWDQDMGKGADYNMLLTFHKVTGFKIAPNTEAIEISRLRRFPKHAAPPFVYITGKGGIHLSRSEVETLRWYCLTEGGMIFADNGGGSFDHHFRQLCHRVFPGQPLIDIADDDIIYRRPFAFPNGAPPLWHHSGYRALGIRHKGRWVVFYHRGDINDAWKTGHSGASKTVASRAYKMGINVMHYAFTKYLAQHRRE